MTTLPMTTLPMTARPMTALHRPPPTKFAPSPPSQAKTAAPGPAEPSIHVPPPTRFGPVQGAQAKSVPAGPSPARHLPPPTRFQPAETPAVQAKTASSRLRDHPPRHGRKALQRMQQQGPVTTTQSAFYTAAKDTYFSGDMQVTLSNLKNGGQDVQIYLTDTVTDHQAHLHGDVETSGQAYVMTLESGKYPGGRGVSYLLLKKFAQVIKGLGATSISLGTAVNKKSLENSGYTREEHPGEWAAVTVYGHMGWNVDTRKGAETSTVTPDQLLQNASLKATQKGWL